jgi:hypothetical protein
LLLEDLIVGSPARLSRAMPFRDRFPKHVLICDCVSGVSQP